MFSGFTTQTHWIVFLAPGHHHHHHRIGPGQAVIEPTFFVWRGWKSWKLFRRSPRRHFFALSYYYSTTTAIWGKCKSNVWFGWLAEWWQCAWPPPTTVELVPLYASNVIIQFTIQQLLVFSITTTTFENVSLSLTHTGLISSGHGLIILTNSMIGLFVHSCCWSLDYNRVYTKKAKKRSTITIVKLLT